MIALAAVVIAIALGGILGRLVRSRRNPRPVWGQISGDDTPLDVLSGWFYQRCDEHTLVEAVTERTWHDLEMDGLFRSIDHCFTPLGRQQLVSTLRASPNAAERDLVSKLAEALAVDGRLRDDVTGALALHRGFGGYALWRLIRAESLGGPWLRVAPVFALVGCALLIAAFWQPIAIAAFIPLALVGLWIRTYATGSVSDFLGAFRELAPVLRVAERLSRIDHPSLAPLRISLAPPGVNWRRLKHVSRWVSREVASSNELAASLFEYVNIVLMLDANSLLAVRRDLHQHRAALERMFVAIGQVDVARSIGSLRASWPCWCRPEFGMGNGVLDFDAIRHPQLLDAVENNVRLVAGRGLLLTGANMSGKSTLLRTLGINVILGASLDTCAAHRATLPLERVYTCLGHTDDIATGKSYFYSEAEVVVQLLHRAVQQRALFLFDELFRGTNASERMAAAEAVMRAVAVGGTGVGGQYVVLATHDLELGSLLADCFEAWHLESTIIGGEVQFRYRMQRGLATVRTALLLLTRLGAPVELIAAADARAAKLEELS